MKVTILGSGTSQGVPVIGCDCSVCTSLDYRDNRFRTSIHIAINGKSFIVDSGPDFRQQVLRARIQTLDALLFTHEHKDHTAGMDDIRAFNFKQQKDIPIYGRAQVLEQLKREYAYVFSEKKYPGIPQVETHVITNEPYKAAGIDIIPIEVMHHRLPVFGFRIQDFTYITDAKTIAKEECEKIKGSKVLIINALQKQSHLSHLTLDEAIDFAREMDADQTYFTHISHRMGKHASVSQELPEGIHLAYDGLEIML